MDRRSRAAFAAARMIYVGIGDGDKCYLSNLRQFTGRESVLLSRRPGASTLRSARSFRRSARHCGETGVLRPEWTIRANVAAPLRVVTRAARLVGRNELMLTAAYQVCATHPTQGLTQHRPVVRIVVPQKCLV